MEVKIYEYLLLLVSDKIIKGFTFSAVCNIIKNLKGYSNSEHEGTLHKNGEVTSNVSIYFQQNSNKVKHKTNWDWIVCESLNNMRKYFNTEREGIFNSNGK